MSRNRKKKQTKKPSNNLANKIIKIFEAKPRKQFHFKQIQKKLIVNSTKDEIAKALDQLVTGRMVTVNEFGRFVLARQSNVISKQVKPSKTITGIVDLTANGSAYIVTKEMDQDVYIPSRYINQAFDGDRVKVAVYTRKNRRPEGEIIEIISRDKNDIVGTLKLNTDFGFVIPDRRKVPVDIFIPPGELKKARDGDRVIVRIINWPKDRKNPNGEIIERLGALGSNDVEMKSILVENGFPLHFSQAAKDELANMDLSISQKEIETRKDFRDIVTFTIDPEDAKDFDDALSIRKISDDNWEVGIHIADVSHYIQPGSSLDRDAYKRATSVYLVDRVLPMLPEELSNIVCSLRPNEEKLCYSAVFNLNSHGKILNRWFGRTVIKSNRRFTYEEAQEIIETGKGDFSSEINQLNKISLKLRDDKFKNGAIAFETVEIKFKVDLEGVPIGVFIKERKEAHLLIEDFMLLANKEVAKFATPSKSKEKQEKGSPFVYRIHDQPDFEKLMDFSRFAAQFGYKLNIGSPEAISDSLNILMIEIKGKPEQDLLEQLAIRSMAKAVYSTHNIGHYGLAFPHYTHFTSPIRRYPDIMVHRLLTGILDKKPIAVKTQLEEQCVHSSWMERKAMSAERESQKYKQTEFMSTRIGEEFDGIISGVVNFGLFVEVIETRCEGLVDIDSMSDDVYLYFEKESSLIGRDHAKRYRLGDTVRIKVLRTDLLKRRTDYQLIS